MAGKWRPQLCHCKRPCCTEDNPINPEFAEQRLPADTAKDTRQQQRCAGRQVAGQGSHKIVKQ